MALSKKLESLIEKEYEQFVDIYARIRDVEEFTDIKHGTVQALVHWSDETREPFDDCVRNFLANFRAEIKHFKQQGFPGPGKTRCASGVLRTTEHPKALQAN